MEELGGGKLGRKPISLPLLRERRLMAASLRINMFTVSDIVAHLNTLNVSKKWGEVDSGTVWRDLNKIFKAEEKDPAIIEAERNIEVEKLEKIISLMREHIRDRDALVKLKPDDKVARWAKFERTDALNKLAEQQLELIRIKNFDLSKKNVVSVTNIDMRNSRNLYIRATDELITDKKQQQVLIDYLKEGRKVWKKEKTMDEFINEAEESRKYIEGSIVEEVEYEDI